MSQKPTVCLPSALLPASPPSPAFPPVLATIRLSERAGPGALAGAMTCLSTLPSSVSQQTLAVALWLLSPSDVTVVSEEQPTVCGDWYQVLQRQTAMGLWFQPPRS